MVNQWPNEEKRSKVCSPSLMPHSICTFTCLRWVPASGDSELIGDPPMSSDPPLPVGTSKAPENIGTTGKTSIDKHMTRHQIFKRHE